ncbi:MAG: hypothetical protein PHY12_12875, partial [Eubacteriales bacterium]|nr:hypothetical protein [Eubacteriales bacterium]
MGTQVRSMQRRTARTLSAVQAEPPPEKKTGALPPEGSAEWDALAGRRGKRLIRFDRLARNLAVVGALLVTLVALRGAEDGGARSVFAAVQESVNMEWDESLGKLTFVSNLLPESLQAVWS